MSKERESTRRKIAKRIASGALVVAGLGAIGEVETRIFLDSDPDVQSNPPALRIFADEVFGMSTVVIGLSLTGIMLHPFAVMWPMLEADKKYKKQLEEEASKNKSGNIIEFPKGPDLK